MSVARGNRRTLSALGGRTIFPPVTIANVPVKVLVIDDEAAIRLLCRVNLELEGMEVLEAADGLAGLELARAESPDVILLDVTMPELDGWQVAEELLDDERTLSAAIVFLTGRAELRDRARRLGLGGVEYVTKPFDPSELAALVRGLLESTGATERLQRETISQLRQFVSD
jgi:DNA-binding response OmpR family regulator